MLVSGLNYGNTVGRFGGWTLFPISVESLILAQNERWQRGLGMQVEREAVDQFFGRVIRWKVAEG